MPEEYDIYGAYNEQLDNAVANQDRYQDPYRQDALQYYSDKTSGQFETVDKTEQYEPQAQEELTNTLKTSKKIKTFMVLYREIGFLIG